MTVAPHDYEDTVPSKQGVDSLIYSPNSQAKMAKIESKLKRLADLGDINAGKQTQIYLDALGELAQMNPQMNSVLQLIQAGMSQSFQ